MKVCLVWQRFGPYHHARLRACEAYFGERNAEVIGIQVASSGGVHGWLPQGTDHEPLTLFPEVPLESLPRPRVFNAMRDLLDRIEPDAVAVPAYSRPESQAGLWWARARRRVAVVMTDSRRDDTRRSLARERIKRTIVSQFDAALAAGTPQARYIRDLGIPGDRIFLPYDVVDNEFFSTGAATAQADPSAYSHLPGLETVRPFFLAVGRFIERKNFSTLLDAYRAYLSGPTEQPWDLVIVGDGPQREKLAARAEALGLSSHVSFAGYRQTDEVAGYYGLASALIHPATADQWGLVVNEAMAAALPVLVSSGVGAADELVNQGVHGYIFAPRDRLALADAMARLSSQDDLESMRRNVRARIAGLTPESFAQALSDTVAAGEDSAHRRMSLAARCLVTANQLAPGPILAWRSPEQ